MRTFLILLLVFGSLGVSHAFQNKSPNADSSSSSNSATAAATKSAMDQKTKALTYGYSAPIVTKVYKYAGGDDSATAGIGDIIVIEVKHLDSLVNAAGKDLKIRLFINGRKIEKVEPLSGAPDLDKGTVEYRLDRNNDNNKVWADILGAPPVFTSAFFQKPVKISVGLDNGFAIRTNEEESNFSIIRIHRGWFWACCVTVVLYLYIFITMVKKKGLLRDRTVDLSAIGIDTNGKNNTYSLARVQMAFWFTITVISFFFIWLITDAYNILSTTVLSLIGISGATALSAAVVDNSKATDLLNQTIGLQTELDGLNHKVGVLQTQIAAVPAPANLGDLQNQLATTTARALQIPALISNNKQSLTPQPSINFLNDILQDPNGVSFHRLQMLVWTLVLGMIFIYSVWKSLSMPDFDGTLLALQGITAGTYLGFKFPEKQ